MRRPLMLASCVTVLLSASPREARADEDAAEFVPVVRVAMGPAIHVAPSGADEVELGFDATAGVAGRPVPDTPFFIDPEVGYTFDSLGLHAFNATFGVGVGNPGAVVGYQPRFILGSLEGELAVGMRNALAVHGLLDMASLEIGHQLVVANGTAFHDIRVMFGLNPAAFVYIVGVIGDAL